jgi:hypothetical protein
MWRPGGTALLFPSGRFFASGGFTACLQCSELLAGFVRAQSNGAKTRACIPAILTCFLPALTGAG